MMTNIFSIFDPTVYLLSFSWFLFVFCLFFVPSFYWLGGYVSFFYGLVLNFFVKEVNYSVLKSSRGLYKFISSVFCCLLMFNFFAIFPFFFSLTSHLLVTFPFSYSFWFGIIFFVMFKSFRDFLVHLIPMGTPTALISFMVLVELVSNFIRPLALTFRLTANMMAGHLLMSLVGGSIVCVSSIVFFWGGSLFLFLLVVMELGVSVIQSYVFTTLILLYHSEGE